MNAGVFVLGFGRSGTSAATRLIGLLGLRTPLEEDLVPPSSKNPRGYWESMSLTALNTRVLAAVESDMQCPRVLGIGWERDSRLDQIRPDARDAFRRVFPKEPWVWKDPRNCLTLPFWSDALDVRPVVVLIVRNPLEIAASSERSRGEDGKIFTLALWERYLRQALVHLAGLPVLVTSYEDLLTSPLDWCDRAQSFLAQVGVPAGQPSPDDVLSFVDRRLRHAEFTNAEFMNDVDVSDAQRALLLALEQLEGAHRTDFIAPDLPGETPTTDALLEERRRTLQIKRDLTRLIEQQRASRPLASIRDFRYAGPARRLYAGLRRSGGPIA